MGHPGSKVTDTVSVLVPASRDSLPTGVQRQVAVRDIFSVGRCFVVWN